MSAHLSVMRARTGVVKRELPFALLLLLLCGCGDDEAPLPKVSNGYHRSIESERLASRDLHAAAKPRKRTPAEVKEEELRNRKFDEELKELHAAEDRFRKVQIQAQAHSDQADDIYLAALRSEPHPMYILDMIRATARRERLTAMGYTVDAATALPANPITRKPVAPEVQKKLFDHSLGYLQKALGIVSKQKASHRVVQVMVDIIKGAFAAGRDELARKTAEELTADYGKYEHMLSDVDVEHDDNMILCLLALKRNDVAESLKRLKMASNVEGDRDFQFPAIPALLTSGHRDEVIAYFKRTRNHNAHKGTVDQWISELEAGEIPSDEEWQRRLRVELLCW